MLCCSQHQMAPHPTADGMRQVRQVQFVVSRSAALQRRSGRRNAPQWARCNKVKNIPLRTQLDTAVRQNTAALMIRSTRPQKLLHSSNQASKQWTTASLTAAITMKFSRHSLTPTIFLACLQAPRICVGSKCCQTLDGRQEGGQKNTIAC